MWFGAYEMSKMKKQKFQNSVGTTDPFVFRLSTDNQTKETSALVLSLYQSKQLAQS